MKTLIFFIIFLSVTEVKAQYNGKDFSLSAGMVYTTSAKIFLSPNSSDPFLRNNSFPLSDILNPSFEFRYLIMDQLIASLNVEYMTASDRGRNLTVFIGGSTATIEVEDGFKLIPIELSLYYLMPFSSNSFKFLMGGGIGYYHGEHTRKFGNAEVLNEERKAAYGIQVAIGMDYIPVDNIIIKSEMKFRDPQFTVTSRYTDRDVVYNNTTIRLAQETFDSKINVDGVTFLIGLAYQF
jgi:outer membrane protein W